MNPTISNSLFFQAGNLIGEYDCCLKNKIFLLVKRKFSTNNYIGHFLKILHTYKPLFTIVIYRYSEEENSNSIEIGLAEEVLYGYV